MRGSRVAAVPRAGEYLTDGTRLLQVIAHDAGALLCEDAIGAADLPAPIVRIKPDEIDRWRTVVPLPA